MKDLYIKKLQEIGEVIRLNYSESSEMGVLSGLSGISMFEFYKGRFFNEPASIGLGWDILHNCIDRINDGYNYPTYCTGIAGLGWVIDHLYSNDFIDMNNDNVLSPLDEYLYDNMCLEMNRKNYDFLHGSIGYAYYFLGRYKTTKSNELKKKYKLYILKFISLSIDIAEFNQDYVCWKFKRDGKDTYDLGLSHGISSFIIIFLKLANYHEFKPKVLPLIIKSINFLLRYKRPYSMFSLFPNLTHQSNSKTRVGWCYGDLGIGLALFQATQIKELTNYRDLAIMSLEHTAKRVSKEDSRVMDAGLCHGSFGNAQIFNRLYMESNNKNFKKCSEIWLRDGLQRSTFENGYAGFCQWKPNHGGWIKELGVLEGVSGIGLSIISNLNQKLSSWDECLFIS